jgi:hypothetical protein
MGISRYSFYEFSQLKISCGKVKTKCLHLVLAFIPKIIFKVVWLATQPQIKPFLISYLHTANYFFDLIEQMGNTHQQKPALSKIRLFDRVCDFPKRV